VKQRGNLKVKKVHLDGLNKFIGEGIIGTMEERAYLLANGLYCGRKKHALLEGGKHN